MPASNKQTRKATESAARERAAALKAQHDREARQRKLLARGGIGLVLAAVVGTIVVIGVASNGPKTPSGTLPTVTAQGAATAPPWAVPTNTSAQVNLAGLTLLPNETLDRHDHVHLDIWVDGKKQTVPAYIGIAGGANSTGLSSLHTHDSSGVIHIESPSGRRFTLSQVFNEWNVLLSPTQIGSLKTGAGKTLTTYVNGKVLTTDPSKLELIAHQEIAIVYGTPAENKTVTVPKSYKWTGGL
ncbi:hypothetical protein acdb102_35690 [Acidothermaceae bacterium B102]|nr:hypothetical protein acdb102_35690 [Acidothermaceae bacterium B102]